MIFWKQTRIPFLAFTFIIGALVTAKVILRSNLDKSKIHTFTFPEKVSLPQGQASLIAPIETSSKKQKHPELFAQSQYQYIKNNLPVDIEMRYLKNLYNADVNFLIQNYTFSTSSATVHQKEGIGYYGLGIEQQKAYLSACINPRGGSTFTHAQYRNNRYFKDISFERLLPLLKGEEPLLDKRCLWVYISIPVQHSSPDASYKILENIWASWYKWWQPRFPKV
ncbi:cyanoexosortase A system-associated protein [Tolypothrix sp. PCC 7910]|uniref:cyanoexosortase A system-associated protein n=1 Tax=Tolypothrix sp. PCC 7910 TaxID=2099387 RepID=UPI00142774D3|nr:cyanoexosortase A system-associated protein [Tolypothrix sp. PCC 7910]QIR39499.1 cyanoexosortase A system-associated protein [Tolypothrix sp. PCC 7910]